MSSPSSLAPLLLAVLTLACRSGMEDQHRYDPLAASDFFEDGRSARPHLEDTVARGQLRLDTHRYEGTIDGELAETFPFDVTAEVLARGQERYNIFCAPCHDRAGTGNGIIVQRGFREPPSYHEPRMRATPVGHYYDVITRGFGAMADYGHLISPDDRWAIVAYVRALQFSQWAPLGAAPADVRDELRNLPEETP